jgi:lipopolysaccharide/colanic/teichoic acid biosynthesis glycosyltransferase
MCPVFSLTTPRKSAFTASYVRTGKDILDRCAAALLLVVLAPVLAAVAAAVRVGLGRGVFFVQQRAGIHGRPFACLKFRTMRPDRRLARAPWVGRERRSGLPSADDPRHTALGTALRRFGLDELPQLANIVRGEMSLVGPRPELLDVAATYDDRERLRFTVRPGLTGYWQVTHRSDGVDLRRFAAIDAEYALKVSLANDLRILLRTPGAVLRHPAATECRRNRRAGSWGRAGRPPGRSRPAGRPGSARQRAGPPPEL